MRYNLRRACTRNITSRIGRYIMRWGTHCMPHPGRKRRMHPKGIVFLWAFLVILPFFPHRVLAARYPEPLLVRIGLATHLGEVTLELSGGETLLDLSAKEPRPQPLPGDLLTFNQSGGLLFCNGIPFGPGPVLLIPSPNGSFLAWNGRNYRGAFIITPQGSGINLVNLLHLEEYLRGVVPREAIPEWPLAALKAQAIAARTYSIVSLKRHIRDGFDLCATDHCQVYGGIGAEHPGTDRAVAETAGQVLTYNAKPISALYHSASGGFTEDAANVWQQPVPYLKPVPDWDQNSPYTEWTRSFDWSELEGLAARSYPGIGRLQRLLPVSLNKDGRILKISLRGDLGEVTLSAEQLRSLTGVPSSNLQMAIIYGPAPYITLWWVHSGIYPEVLVPDDTIPGLTADLLNPPWDLPDPWFWLSDKEPYKVVFRGSGWGHRVGMSQWGAKGMADNGYSTAQILAHYYPGTRIMNLGELK